MNTNVIDDEIAKLPKKLIATTNIKFEKLQQSLTEANLKLPKNNTFQKQLVKSFACSNFISQFATKNPNLLIDSFERHYFSKKIASLQYSNNLKAQLEDNIDETTFNKKLRQFRNMQMCRIAWRDINDLADLSETMRELSELADIILNTSLDFCSELLFAKKEYPTDFSGNRTQFSILALGKLGSFELNFSSDIDLIFCYSETKPEFETSLLKLAQKLISVLNNNTEDGFVFRVDMRLRPFGSSGSLICSHKSITSYFQTQGREWERFALAKARLVNPNPTGEELMDIIKNFVYRRHTDFGIISSLREIKARMRRESQNYEDNIKRGPGGIREVEFIVQVFQLIRGGKEPWLQNASIFKTLHKLADLNCLPKKVVVELFDAYKFLRKTEHCLQEINDQQTQALPQDDLARTQLFFALQFANYDTLLNKLDEQRNIVLEHFNAMIAPPKDYRNKKLIADERLQGLILENLSKDEVINLLQDLGAKTPEEILQIFVTVLNQYSFTAMHDSVVPKFAILLQQFLPIIFKTENASLLLKRVLGIFEKIIRRSIYLDLLIENPAAITQLVTVCNASSWITNLLTDYPFLLDELIDQKTLYQPYDTTMLNDQLRQHMLSIPLDDIEQQMDCLRKFKKVQTLRVAVSDAIGILPLMKISDHLSNTAAVIVAHAQRTAWIHLTNKHGNPISSDHQIIAWNDFGVVAYGKLGGLELSYNSDLDLVFIHPDTKINEMTDGPKPISNLQFYLRLAQRMTHILSVGTSMGNLYEVDTRLRPLGQSGLLVCSFSGYANYLSEKAWTWELQALTRTRLIVGSNKLEKNFKALRKRILTQKREPDTLRQDIVKMRQKMLQQLPKRKQNCIDVNLDRGSIKDIEFITQYLVLRFASEQPEIIAYSDNIRIIELLEKYGYLSSEDAQNLCHSYCQLRKIIHDSALEDKLPIVEKEKISHLIAPIEKIWKQLFTVA